MKQYLQYTLRVKDEIQRDLCIAYLAEFGFDGFEEKDTTIIASGSPEKIDATLAKVWLNEQRIEFKSESLEDQNWNAVWERNFLPVMVYDFVGVRAHFHDVIPGVQYELVITPKMSFGTGHHATTWQMLNLMQKLPIAGKRVFDFGTGTGILAILAHKMGALDVEAIDNDEWSIANAAENIAANNCESVLLRLCENITGVQPAQIVLANINKHIILQFGKDLEMIVDEGGYLLLSGLLADDETEIDSMVLSGPFLKESRTERSGWIALLYKR